MVVEDVTRVKDYLNKTKLTTLDYVINPYVGCPNNAYTVTPLTCQVSVNIPKNGVSLLI